MVYSCIRCASLQAHARRPVGGRPRESDEAAPCRCFTRERRFQVGSPIQLDRDLVGDGECYAGVERGIRSRCVFLWVHQLLVSSMHRHEYLELRRDQEQERFRSGR